MSEGFSILTDERSPGAFVAPIQRDDLGFNIALRDRSTVNQRPAHSTETFKLPSRSADAWWCRKPASAMTSAARTKPILPVFRVTS
jgi:hypothetical protein